MSRDASLGPRASIATLNYFLCADSAVSNGGPPCEFDVFRGDMTGHDRRRISSEIRIETFLSDRYGEDNPRPVSQRGRGLRSIQS